MGGGAGGDTAGQRSFQIGWTFANIDSSSLSADSDADRFAPLTNALVADAVDGLIAPFHGRGGEGLGVGVVSSGLLHAHALPGERDNQTRTRSHAEVDPAGIRKRGRRKGCGKNRAAKETGSELTPAAAAESARRAGRSETENRFGAFAQHNVVGLLNESAPRGTDFFDR